MGTLPGGGEGCLFQTLKCRNWAGRAAWPHFMLRERIPAVSLEQTGDKGRHESGTSRSPDLLQEWLHLTERKVQKSFPSHPLIFSPVCQRNRKAELGFEFLLKLYTLKGSSWMAGDSQATWTGGRALSWSPWFKRVVWAKTLLLKSSGCQWWHPRVFRNKKPGMQRGTAGSWCKIKRNLKKKMVRNGNYNFLSLTQQLFSTTKQKKIWQRETNDWGTPTTENKGKYFSLISKPCLCRQTLTVVYSNKPIPPQLYHWIRNAEVQSKYLDYSWLKHCARISSTVKTPLNSFPLGLCLLCPVTVTPMPLRQDCISQGAFPASVWSAKSLKWTRGKSRWQHTRAIPGSPTISWRSLPSLNEDLLLSHSFSQGSGGRDKLRLASKSPWLGRS